MAGWLADCCHVFICIRWTRASHDQLIKMFALGKNITSPVSNSLYLSVMNYAKHQAWEMVNGFVNLGPGIFPWKFEG